MGWLYSEVFGNTQPCFIWAWYKQHRRGIVSYLAMYTAVQASSGVCRISLEEGDTLLGVIKIFDYWPRCLTTYWSSFKCNSICWCGRIYTAANAMWGPEFHTPTAHLLDFTPTCLPCLNFLHLSHDVYCFSIPSNSVPLSLVYVWNFPPPLQNSSIFVHLVGISCSQHVFFILTLPLCCLPCLRVLTHMLFTTNEVLHQTQNGQRKDFFSLTNINT